VFSTQMIENEDVGSEALRVEVGFELIFFPPHLW
jgi:hypothetical protein